IGERTAKMYRIGDEVKIKVASVNLDEYTVDFELYDQEKPKKAKLDNMKGFKPPKPKNKKKKQKKKRKDRHTLGELARICYNYSLTSSELGGWKWQKVLEKR